MVTKEKILLFGVGEDTPRGAELKKLLAALRAEVKFIGADALGQKVGYLCGLPGYQREAGESAASFEDELMILQGFSGARLNQLLALFRTSGVRKVDLKAAVTETNRDWSLGELAVEIRKEHEYMKKI